MTILIKTAIYKQTLNSLQVGERVIPFSNLNEENIGKQISYHG
jgi:hypothetical protein